MGAYRRLTLDQRRELARRHQRGEGAAALAAAYGVAERSVYRTARRESAETARTRDPTVSVSFRAPRSEVEAFDALALDEGLGRRGSALRALVRMATGLVELRGGEMERLHHAAVVASRLGINLNQLARAVNRGKLRLGDEDRALLWRLAREVENLRREWSAVREQAGAWRAYALRGLGEAAAGEASSRETADG